MKIAPVNYKMLVNIIRKSIETRERLIIYYANFNTINLINKDNYLKEVFDDSHFVHPDGTGIWLASKFLYKHDIQNFNWTDNGLKFLKECESEGWKIFFLGGTDKILNKAADNLHRLFPNLKLAGYKNGFDDTEKSDLIDQINSAGPDILWVGMGTPKQELWIHENKLKLNCTVIQAVGDFFTFLAGEKKRGPNIFRKLGFEWIVRVIHNPERYFIRYFTGIPKFLLLVLREKIKTAKQS